MKKLLLFIFALLALGGGNLCAQPYVVAGDPASIFGTSWNANDTNNVMEQQTDGIYRKTYTNVPATKGVQLKVVNTANHDWIGDETGNNVTFDITQTSDFTVEFDANAYAITVKGDGVYFENQLDYTSVYTVGNGSGTWLNGEVWTPNASSNQMTQTETDLWVITYENVPVASDHQVKFAIDGTWTRNFGGTFVASGQETAADYNGNNITFATTEAGSTVKVQLDLRNFNYTTKSGATFTITISGPETESTAIAIDETHFPDANFRSWVAYKDTDNDGTLSAEEIAAVDYLYVQEKGIANLEGIEYFTGLTELYCGANQLTSLDVSKNVKLETLSCFNNQLTALNLSQNTVLESLRCDDNQLTELDISKNTKLRSLECSGNQLTSLDVSQNSDLETLSCRHNSIAALDVTSNLKLTELNIGENAIAALDLSKNADLYDLTCDYNQLSALDLTNNPKLMWLYCIHNRLTNLTISADCDDLEEIDCYWNQLKGSAVDALIASLPNASNNKIYFQNPLNTNESNVLAPRRAPSRSMATVSEGNEMTTQQVADAKAKGWTPYVFTGSTWKEYEGAQPSTDHEYVDLGLPSGTLWATMNVGATAEEEYGYYFAWGETVDKTGYYWDDYKFNGGAPQGKWSKYCTNASQGYNGFTDGLTELLPEDDAATQNWGDYWRTPTASDFTELMGNTTREVITVNGVKGMKLSSKTDSGKYIFLPFSGYKQEGTYNNTGSLGQYQARTYEKDSNGGNDQMRVWHDKDIDIVGTARWAGLCVRPIYNPSGTGINSVTTTEKALNGVRYNLSGQRVDNNYRGIVILNGRKVVVK